MIHSQPKMAGRYIKAFSWHSRIEEFVSSIIKETPILHVCSGPISKFGNVRLDRFIKPYPPGVVADWCNLPFQDNSFESVFADPPWNLGQMKTCANFCKEGLRVAPIVYLMAPWLWVTEGVKRTHIWVREFPGVNVPILIVRYQRPAQLTLALPTPIRQNWEDQGKK